MLSFAIGCTAIADADTTEYSRVIVFSQNLPWGGPSTPIDTNHHIALSLLNKKGDNLYTQAQVDAITQAAIDELKANFGIDFGPVPADPATGLRVLPGVGVFLPYILGVNKQITLIEDSENPNRAHNNWYYIIVGNLVSFGATPVAVTSGVNAGATIPANSLWSSGELNILKEDSNKREIIRLTTSQVGLQAFDQWGNRSFNFVMDTLDEDNNQGFFQSSTTVVKQPPGTGPLYLKEYPVLTWPQAS